MRSERRRTRGICLSRCASFLGCFNGVQEKSYERSASLEEEPQKKKQPRKFVQLGSKAPKKLFPFSCATKVKEACGQALEVAKKGSPHIGELFAGGQLFTQVAPLSVGHKPYRQQVSPSIGFLHMATSISPDSSLPDR